MEEKTPNNQPNKMPDYDNEKRFVLFPKKNQTNPKAPTHEGTITIDGKEWEMSAWAKTSKNGTEFLSGSIKEPFKKKSEEPPF